MMEGNMPDGYVINAGEMSNIDESALTPPDQAGAKQKRQKSEIPFVYVDLEDAVTVARALLDLGGVPCDRDQLAAKMGHSLSGAFVNKASAARLFGLMEVVSDKYQLTQLGHAALDVTRSGSAKAEAFLRVGLHRKLYDEFRNSLLPPSPHGLEQAIVGFGVPEKQKDKARRAFENSAQQAGFFAHGQDRLVAPVITTPWNGVQSDSGVTPRPPKELSPVTLPAPAEHPFIKGLLLSLPEKLGVDWSAADRVKWLQTAADQFDLMFKGGAPIVISLAATPRPRAPRKASEDDKKEVV
jgi:hypothetical protein